MKGKKERKIITVKRGNGGGQGREKPAKKRLKLPNTPTRIMQSVGQKRDLYATFSKTSSLSFISRSSLGYKEIQSLLGYDRIH